MPEYSSIVFKFEVMQFPLQKYLLGKCNFELKFRGLWLGGWWRSLGILKAIDLAQQILCVRGVTLSDSGFCLFEGRKYLIFWDIWMCLVCILYVGFIGNLKREQWATFPIWINVLRLKLIKIVQWSHI
jgi:hypothetical protein